MNDALQPADSITAAIIDAVNASKITRRELAARTGMSEASLHRKLTLKRPFKYVEAVRIAGALNLSLSEAVMRFDGGTR